MNLESLDGTGAEIDGPLDLDRIAGCIADWPLAAALPSQPEKAP
jgi:hypothetical protein